jgi:tetratricopeptide (TPR) repeat protein
VDRISQHLWWRRRWFGLWNCFLAAVSGFALACGIAVAEAPGGVQAQSTPHKRSANQNPEESSSSASSLTSIPASSALAELQKRAAAVQAARQAGDALAVAQASRALIAVGLRQVAHLRLVEDAYPAAIDLYKRSLDFEENPSTRVDLAIADLRAKRYDDALTEAGSAILKDGEDARAWRIQGMTYMSKGEYAKGADSLQRSIALRDDLEGAYSLAICFMALHQKEKAAAVFKQMDEEAANRGAMHVLMARAYRDGGYLDDAVRELRTALELDPKTRHAHYLLGVVYLLQEEWAPKPKIREQFLAELRLNPRDFLSNYLLGATESTLKNFSESDKYLKNATAIQPEWSEPWLYLGMNANSRGDIKNAETYFRKAITLNGADDSRSNFTIRKAYLALGRILSQTGRKEEARPFLQKARELEERVQADSVNNSPQTGGMGGANDAYIATGELKTAEERTAPDFSRQDPTAELDDAALSRVNLTAAEKEAALGEEKRLRALLGASFNDLATSEAIRQQYELALNHYQEAEHWDAESPGLVRNLGVTAVKAGKYGEAVKALRQVLASNPKDNPARAMLGMSYYMTDNYKEAAQTIEPLGDAALKDPGLGYAWADALVKQQELQAAGAVLDRLERTPLSADTLMLVGRLWEEVGNHMRAVASYHKVLEMVPTEPKAHYFAGAAYIKADRPADAATEFQAELALAPDDADARYNLGYAYLQESRRDEAAALFEEVVKAHPEHADAQYEWGKMLMDQGKVKAGIVHLEAAARLKPQADYIHYQLQAAYRMDSRIEDADRELALYKEIKAGKRERQAQGMGRD